MHKKPKTPLSMSLLERFIVTEFSLTSIQSDFLFCLGAELWIVVEGAFLLRTADHKERRVKSHNRK